MNKNRTDHPHILVADDDRDMLTMLKIGLESSGYKVLISFNAENIYEMIQEDQPDVIVLDITMIGKNGAEICKSLKRHHEIKLIPLIMISANQNGEKLANECGADHFLAKPFKMDTLKKTILDTLH